MRRTLPALLLALCLTAAGQAGARAQPAFAGAPDAAWALGQVATATGPLSLRSPQGAWLQARPGAGLAPGQALRTGPATQAEIDLGADRIGLDPATILRLDGATQGGFAATLEQGRAMVLLRGLQPGQTATLATPRATITFGENGLYTIDAGDAARPLTIGTSRGLAQAYGPGISLAIPPGQTGVVPATGPATLRQGVAEGFLADNPAAPLPGIVRPAPPPPAAPAALAGLPGAEALQGDGAWETSPDHGAVWYPPVAPGWNPYADAWSAAPWAYTPWFYGTWVPIGPRWGWLPPPPAWRRPVWYPPPPPGGRPPPAYAQPGRPPPAYIPSPHRRPPPIIGGRPVPPLNAGPAPGRPPDIRRGSRMGEPTIGGRPISPPFVSPPFAAPPGRPPPMRPPPIRPPGARP
jgi:hypothetical protein